MKKVFVGLWFLCLLFLFIPVFLFIWTSKLTILLLGVLGERSERNSRDITKSNTSTTH